MIEGLNDFVEALDHFSAPSTGRGERSVCRVWLSNSSATVVSLWDASLRVMSLWSSVRWVRFGGAGAGLASPRQRPRRSSPRVPVLG